MNYISPTLEGLLLGGGLIIAIGAQNAFILRQGLLRQHVFVLCLIASVSDAILIAAGVAGVGSLVQSNPQLLFIITLAGAGFLLVYSIMAARRAYDPKSLSAAKSGASSLSSAIATLLAFTFLNPHVYLDTVLLVGGLSAQHMGTARLAFAIGAMAASFIWFFAVGYGAGKLTPLFAKPGAWRLLDGVIAIIMLVLSISLMLRAFA